MFLLKIHLDHLVFTENASKIPHLLSNKTVSSCHFDSISNFWIVVISKKAKPTLILVLLRTLSRCLFVSTLFCLFVFIEMWDSPEVWACSANLSRSLWQQTYGTALPHHKLVKVAGENCSPFSHMTRHAQASDVCAKFPAKIGTP